MKKIILAFISISISFFTYSQKIEIEETIEEAEIEETIIESTEEEGPIMTADNMYTNKNHKKLVYDKTIKGLTFINGYDGSLKAYDHNQKLQWSFTPEDGNRLHNGRNKFYYKDGVIFTAYLTGYIYALNAKDGNIFWQGKIGLDKGELKLRGQQLKPYNDKLYLTSENGHIYVFNALNGKMIWNYRLAYQYNHIPNLVHNEIVYIPNAPYVYNFNATTGKALYQRGFKKAMYGKPVTDGKNIIIANESNTIFSLTPNDLSINWEFQLDKGDYNVKEKIIVENNAIYLGTYSNTEQAAVYKANTADGTKMWSTKIPEKRIQYITLVEDVIYGYTKEGSIFSIKKDKGKLTHISTLKNKPISNLEFKNKSIYYYAKAGLIAYNLKSKKEEIIIPYSGIEKKAGDSQILLLY